jgi:hypothetical protein
MISGLHTLVYRILPNPDKKFIDSGIVRRLNMFPAIQVDQGIPSSPLQSSLSRSSTVV